MKRESLFQSELIRDIEDILPGSIVLKIDPTASHRQGFPDLLILYGPYWAALEAKRSETSNRRPNQDYYVSLLNDWSYASFIFPQNKEEILHEIKQVFKI